jgi:hypothetical protein
MCNRFFSTSTKYASKSDISKRIEFFLEGNKGEIQWKYSRNKPSELGEIVNSAAISTYFTERSGVYFYTISTVFRNSPALRGGYFVSCKVSFLI